MQKLKVAHSKTEKTSCDIQVEGVRGNNADTSVGGGGLKSSHSSALTRVSFLWLPLHRSINMSPVLTCLLFSPSPPLAPSPRPRLQYPQVPRSAGALPGGCAALAATPAKQGGHRVRQVSPTGSFGTRGPSRRGWGGRRGLQRGVRVVSCVVLIYNLRAFSFISYEIQDCLRHRETKLYTFCKEENYSLKFNPGGCI